MTDQTPRNPDDYTTEDEDKDLLTIGCFIVGLSAIGIGFVVYFFLRWYGVL